MISTGTALIKLSDLRRIRATFHPVPRRCICLKAKQFRFGIGRLKTRRAPYLSVSSSSLRWIVTSSSTALVFIDIVIIFYIGGDNIATLRRMISRSGYLKWTCRVFHARHENAIKGVLHPDDDPSGAKDAVFTASRENLCFECSTTLHAIGTKRLRRMEQSIYHRRYTPPGLKPVFADRSLMFMGPRSSQLWERSANSLHGWGSPFLFSPML